MRFSGRSVNGGDPTALGALVPGTRGTHGVLGGGTASVLWACVGARDRLDVEARVGESEKQFSRSK